MCLKILKHITYSYVTHCSLDVKCLMCLKQKCFKDRILGSFLAREGYVFISELKDVWNLLTSSKKNALR